MTKKRNEASSFQTDAQKIFGGKELIISRPNGMSRDEYRMIRKLQTELLKRLFPKPPLRRLNGIIPKNRGQIMRGFKQQVKQRKSG